MHPLIPDEIAQDYVDKGYWQGRTLSDYVSQWAVQTPGKLAVWHQEVRVTYAELDLMARRIAGDLLDAGVEPGSNVMAVLGLHPHSAIVTAACSRLGVALAGMSSMQSAARCANRMAALRPSALIIEADLLDRPEWRDIWDSLGDGGVAVVMTIGTHPLTSPKGVRLLRYEETADHGRLLDEQMGSGDRVSSLITTGGTTGEPKTVMQFDDGLIFASLYEAKCARLTADDVYIGVGPFGHIMTVYAFYIPLVLGATCVPLYGWSRGRDFLDCVADHEGTASMMTATHAYDLWALPDGGEEKLATLRTIASAGKPDDFFVKLDQRYGIRMLRCYGMSEVNLWVMASVDDDDAGNADGLPCPGAEILLTDEGRGRPAKVGQVGELAVCSPGVGHGYYGRPDLTREICGEDGFFHSGDLATVSAGGYVRIVGRSKEQIRRGGVNIVPKELDAILLAHPDIAEACVIGLPDERLGEIVVAGVVAAPGADLTLESVRRYMLEHGVPATELPDRIAQLESIPRNELGRFNRNAVREMLLGRSG